jgi:MYXO-CTERM domain-containing protein
MPLAVFLAVLVTVNAVAAVKADGVHRASPVFVGALALFALTLHLSRRRR